MIRAIARLSLVAALALLSPLAAADTDAGLRAYEAGQYETALGEWQPLADAGDKGAQFGLGTMYANGFGVPLDDAQALHWFGLSAAQGYAKAQYRLGVMHQNGWGVPMNDELAADWYEKAAEQGLTEAQVAVSQIYAAEYSTLYNVLEAYKWLAVATKLDNHDATSKRDEIAARMSAEQLEQANLLVNEWFQAHASLVAE